MSFTCMMLADFFFLNCGVFGKNVYFWYIYFLAVCGIKVKRLNSLEIGFQIVPGLQLSVLCSFCLSPAHITASASRPLSFRF